MTDPNELIVQLTDCLPLVNEGPDHKLWCSVRGDWLRAAVAALTPAPAQPEPPLDKYLPFADVPTPKPQEGTWFLCAPDGRRFFGDSPIKCVRAESKERIPPQVALGRIARSLDEAEPPTAAGALTDAQCDAIYKNIHNRAVRYGVIYGLPFADVADPDEFRALIRAAAAGAG